ncbi:MAG: XRE family transcriptional regulator [Candidatus Methanoplasma sp.]|jgi:quercetin dioxygenase-like cupin family protein/DNA-binding XRE family transcriptional regulator|nr:XRE family transcriptional regulator [Candidatus Methanoplasma sp.]
MDEANKLGSRIRMYRERLNITQEELAERSGTDVVFIKDVEDGNKYPAVGMLIKLSRALGKRLGTFTDDLVVKDPLITKASERSEEGSSHGRSHYHYFPLAKGKTDRHMEPFCIKIDPECGEELSSHEGEEFIMVLSGRIELTYGKDKHMLEPGDSMYYNSLIPHKVSAADDRQAEIFAMIYVPF